MIRYSIYAVERKTVTVETEAYRAAEAKKQTAILDAKSETEYNAACASGDDNPLLLEYRDIFSVSEADFMVNNSGEGLFDENGHQIRGNSQFFAKNETELIRKLNLSLGDSDNVVRYYGSRRGAEKKRLELAA